MIQLYIGDGKGKTTAAIGQAIRTLGWDKKVLFVQFLKASGTGEKRILENMKGCTFIRPDMRHNGFIWNMNEKEFNETKEDIKKGFSEICHLIMNENFSLVVMDEVLDIIDCAFISEEQLIELIVELQPGTEFVLTGRRASERLKDISDYISNITKEKHPFDNGIQSRKGVEY